jgi:general secretion pathway protein K
MTGRPSERGLALVVVLWGVAALALIAGAMLAASMSGARIGHNAWAQVKARTAADAGVQSAILSLFNPGPDGRPSLDGKEQKITFNGAAITVAIQDQTGLIDLNYAGRNELRDYFKAMGAADPGTLADNVVGWRSPKGTTSVNGTAADDYEGYKPRNAPFQSVDELNLVAGMTPELLARVAPGLTVYSHSADFDTRTAPKDVLTLIPGMNETRAAQTVALRTPATARPGHAYGIVATAEQDNMHVTRRAVVQLSADPERPYWILDWR